jgi:hypothetical protein
MILFHSLGDTLGFHPSEKMNTHYLHPAGMNTVFPESDPLYLRNACIAVTAVNGRDAASPKERDAGLRAT